MPDPLPSRASSSLLMSSSVTGSRNPSHSGASRDSLSFPAGSTASGISLSTSVETPIRSNLSVGSLARLNAPRTRSYNFKDDMEVFSPLVEVRPITPSLNNLWDVDAGMKKDQNKKPSYPFPSRRFGLSEDVATDNHPILDWKSNSSSKLDDISSTATSTRADDSSSITPPEAWGGERLSDKFTQNRQSINMPSRFASFSSSSSSSGLMLSGLQDGLPTNPSTSTLTSGLSLASLRTREILNQDTSFGSSEAVSSPLGTKNITGQVNLDHLSPGLSPPRRFSSYAERIGASLGDTSSLSMGSPKSKKTGAETREELLNSFLSRSQLPSAKVTSDLTTANGGAQLQKTPAQSDLQQGSSFTLQLFQRSLEETLASFQNSIHEDMRNLHLEVLRQSHMQETGMSSTLGLILENQSVIMKELQSLRNATQQLFQLL